MVFVYLLMALFGAAAVAFAAQNPEPVQLTFLGWKTTSMPLSFVLLMAVSDMRKSCPVKRKNSHGVSL
jgi:uncharacterized integral membrane protein